MSSQLEAVLLVVDDESTVCRAICRILRSRFADIQSACTPEEAVAVLDSRRVTHVLCDYRLGAGQPTGTELVQRWRSQHPSIERAVILTGVEVTQLEAPGGVDAVVPKASDPTDLADILLG